MKIDEALSMSTGETMRHMRSITRMLLGKTLPARMLLGVGIAAPTSQAVAAADITIDDLVGLVR